MEVSEFVKRLYENDCSFFTGVPDSQLKPLCDYLMKSIGISDKHIIAANEGNAVALAAGYHLSTGKIPCVYLQNSGLGNIINPVASLLNENVYGIPCVFIIGWRGEPCVHDEPQHLFQGKITLELLDVMGITYMVIDKETKEESFKESMALFKSLLESGKSVALVIKKGGLSFKDKVNYQNDNLMRREEIIHAIIDFADKDIIVSTTGKTSRELFEIRDQKGQLHNSDFLTVGSMGHSSSIALSVALNKQEVRVWCIDGDGAALMHMGAMAVIGEKCPGNLVHVVINNGAHESVGGQPTVAGSLDFAKIALACGYKTAFRAADNNELLRVLTKTKESEGPVFIEARSAIGSREDLGRPTTTPTEIKEAFMNYLRDVTN